MNQDESKLHADRREADLRGRGPRMARLSPGGDVWWLRPGTLFPAIVLGSMALAAWMSPTAYVAYGTPKYVGTAAWVIALLAVIGFGAGCLAGQVLGGAPRPLSEQARTALRGWFRAAVVLTLFGYLAWTANGVRNGLGWGQVREIFSSTDHDVADELKSDVLKTVPGVTTCTQFGMAAVLLGCLAPLTRADRWALGLLLALVALRSVLYSERLAGIEILVPGALVLLRRSVLPRSTTVRKRLGMAILPLAAVGALVVGMGASESLRSWRFYRNQFDSLTEFTVWRISGYYATALNNGALAWAERGVWPMPYFTLRWLWHFPLLSQTGLSYPQLAGIDPSEENQRTMALYGTPELNNPGGLFCPTLDFGLVGGGLFWLCFGLAAGRLYREYRAGALVGLLLYPLVFLAILETPRILYLNDVRSFPSLVLLGLVVAVQSRRRAVASGAGLARPAGVVS